MNIFVTGGAGFIGSNFLNLYVTANPQHTFINIDKFTYAANKINLDKIEAKHNYILEKVCITDYSAVDKLFALYSPDIVVHFAAESHVDRSILGPAEFINTNVIGTFNLIESCRKYWANRSNKRFHHVSTDEVFGSLGESGLFSEETPYDPRSPYSASKAASDHLVRAYFHTYNLPVTITNCSNNYGPRQFPEKLIPLVLNNALEGKPIPIYGEGLNIRDWLYVDDHNRAVWEVINNGRIGETYNIGGNEEKTNLEVAHMVCEIIAEINERPDDHYKRLITFVKDRPGHDFRYAINSTKLQTELGWKPLEIFKTGLRKTINWYLDNPGWISKAKSEDYQEWVKKNYSKRF